ncbi:unnamed protein product [Protopolystoma xenopodis]|uniref:Uncharacterized protein n=1 Tax=Protopolystoma xenopodis TaxID=117903 RepID=A0A448WBA4_9PLAT|nr:unnamed protein product [Protopolystoma xenopodis]
MISLPLITEPTRQSRQGEVFSPRVNPRTSSVIWRRRLQLHQSNARNNLGSEEFFPNTDMVAATSSVNDSTQNLIDKTKESSQTRQDGESMSPVQSNSSGFQACPVPIKRPLMPLGPDFRSVKCGTRGITSPDYCAPKGFANSPTRDIQSQSSRSSLETGLSPGSLNLHFRDSRIRRSRNRQFLRLGSENLEANASTLCQTINASNSSEGTCEPLDKKDTQVTLANLHHRLPEEVLDTNEMPEHQHSFSIYRGPSKSLMLSKSADMPRTEELESLEEGDENNNNEGREKIRKMERTDSQLNEEKYTRKHSAKGNVRITLSNRMNHRNEDALADLKNYNSKDYTAPYTSNSSFSKRIPEGDVKVSAHLFKPQLSKDLPLRRNFNNENIEGRPNQRPEFVIRVWRPAIVEPATLGAEQRPERHTIPAAVRMTKQDQKTKSTREIGHPFMPNQPEHSTQANMQSLGGPNAAIRTTVQDEERESGSANTVELVNPTEFRKQQGNGRSNDLSRVRSSFSNSFESQKLNKIRALESPSLEPDAQETQLQNQQKTCLENKPNLSLISTNGFNSANLISEVQESIGIQQESQSLSEEVDPASLIMTEAYQNKQAVAVSVSYKDDNISSHAESLQSLKSENIEQVSGASATSKIKPEVSSSVVAAKKTGLETSSQYDYGSQMTLNELNTQGNIRLSLLFEKKSSQLTVFIREVKDLAGKPGNTSP